MPRKTSKEWVLLQAINDAVLVIDDNFEVQHANSATMILLEVNAEKLFKKNVIHPCMVKIARHNFVPVVTSSVNYLCQTISSPHLRK